MSKAILIRVDEEFLNRFSEVAKSLGLTRSEAIRKAMEYFIAVNTNRPETFTKRMRGLVKSKFSSKELEEIYMVSR